MGNQEAVCRCIEIICDGGAEYGFGHIRRSHTLANELLRRGYAVRYVAASAQGQELLPSFPQLADEQEADLRIVDLPYGIDDWGGVEGDEVSLIALDYFGVRQVVCVVSIFEHRIPPPPGKRYSGLEYALIRSEITELTGNVVSSLNRVLVMIGGSDINRDGEIIANRLAAEGCLVDLIQGPGVQQEYTPDSSLVTVLRTPDDLEMRMSESAWGVTNGGSSMMEMMSLGKAIFVIPQTEAEQHLAELVMDQGGILGVGMTSVSLPDSHTIERIAHQAREVVDGKGAERVANIIEGYL